MGMVRVRCKRCGDNVSFPTCAGVESKRCRSDGRCARRAEQQTGAGLELRARNLIRELMRYGSFRRKAEFVEGS